MKQIIQNYKTGELVVEDVPIPLLKPDGVLVRTICSLISAGTEKSKIETAKMNIFEKAKARPEDVKTLINNMKQEGIFNTVKKAMNKLDTPVTLGYSCSGKVAKVGNSINEFREGDRICCFGEKYATHSEFNNTPVNFCVKIPKNVTHEEAAFGGVGAIALQSIRLADVAIGEKVIVFGLGLIGLITVQILKASGAKVFGIDINDYSIEIAKKIGIDDGELYFNSNIVEKVLNFTEGFGADSIIITASSNDRSLLNTCGEMICEKGKVIVLGVVPLIFSRKNYYAKEVGLFISRAFGAGTYDTNYYSKGIDYPYGYVKWTAKRNVETFLDLVSERKINLSKLVTHRFDIGNATKAYEMIKEGREKYIGVLFTYKKNKDIKFNEDIIIKSSKKCDVHNLNIGFIGAGNFAQGYILPYLKNRKGFNLKGVATVTGNSAKNVMRKFGFDYCTTDYKKIINDKEIGNVFILTRHNIHAKIVIEALKNNKVVYVEKPLAINWEELREIVKTYTENRGKVMVGFNRRFSPLFSPLKEFYKKKSSPLLINYRVNAGNLPFDHWIYDKKISGGRIIGEVCHFIDVMQFLTNSNPINVYADVVEKVKKDIPENDNMIIIIKFRDGSIGNINYSSVGDISFPRERIEIFGENSVGIIDNFRYSILSVNGRVRKVKKISRDMGYRNEVNLFLEAIKNNQDMPIDFNSIIVNTYTTLKIIDSVRERRPIDINIGALLNE